MKLKVEISAGELLDKITILEIKQERIDDEAKLVNVRHELELLTVVGAEALVKRPELDALVAQLKAVNEQLWEIEDEIRDCERRGDFGPAFVDLARAVYRTNDRRMELKGQVNAHTGSDIVEEKSYSDY